MSHASEHNTFSEIVRNILNSKPPYTGEWWDECKYQITELCWQFKETFGSDLNLLIKTRAMQERLFELIGLLYNHSPALSVADLQSGRVQSYRILVEDCEKMASEIDNVRRQNER